MTRDPLNWGEGELMRRHACNVVAVVMCLAAAGPLAAGRWKVEVEEQVVVCPPARFGAVPLWAHGAPMLVRSGDNVYATICQAGEGVAPQHTIQWQLWRRDRQSWRTICSGDGHNELAPCPLVQVGDGMLYVSSNPAWQALSPSPMPELAVCNPVTGQKTRQGVETYPTSMFWYSYRGIAADPSRGEMVLMNIAGDEYLISFRDWKGQWQPAGSLSFPMLSCYPQVGLNRRAVHVLAISNVPESVPQWIAAMEEARVDSGSVYRHLYYTWTSDILVRPFSKEIELCSADKTAGYIRNLDLHVDSEGRAHVLYLKQDYENPVIRRRFFPDRTPTSELVYATILNGQVERQTVLMDSEGRGAGGAYTAKPMRCEFARLHADARGNLHIVAMVAWTGGRHMMVAPLKTDGQIGQLQTLDVKEPLEVFHTATVRGGSAPSDIIDILGANDFYNLRYVRAVLEGPPAPAASQDRLSCSGSPGGGDGSAGPAEITGAQTVD